MSFYARTLLVGFVALLLLTCAAPDAKAEFYTATNISYNGTLAGYSTTFRDGNEDGYALECYPYQGYCVVWYHSFWLTADAELYAPTAGLVGSTGSAGIYGAIAGFVGPVNEYGTWTQWGYHGIFQDISYSICYLVYGEVYCDGWTPAGTEGGYVGPTTQSVYVPPPQPTAPEITFVDWTAPDVWVTVQQAGCYGLVFDSAVPAIDFEYSSGTGLSGSVSGWTHNDQACVSYNSPPDWFTTWRIVSAKATAGTQVLQFGSSGPALTIHEPPLYPEIYDISPAGAARNTSGYFTITGNRLQNASIESCDSAHVQLSAVSSSATTASASYTIQPNAPLGSCTIYLGTPGGYATTAFMIGDATPVISSIDPNYGESGTGVSVTITGSNFGSNPEIHAPFPVSISSSSDSHVNASFYLNVAADNYSITVESHGVGSSFISPGPGQGPISNPVQFTVTPPPGPPSIRLISNGFQLQEGYVLILPFDQSNDLVMPAITAQLVRPGGPALTGDVHWLLTFNQEVNGPGFIPGNSFDQWAQVSQIWNITSVTGGEVHGGNAVSVRADYAENGQNSTIFFHFKIKAVSDVPGGESTFKAYLNTLYVGYQANTSNGVPYSYNGVPPYFATRLIRAESAYQHFNNLVNNPGGVNGYPNYGPPNGWGVMQKENPETNRQVWDWKENMKAGRAEIESKRTGAYLKFEERKIAWNNWNSVASHPHQNAPTEDPNLPCTFAWFAMDQNGNTPPGKHPFSDAIWIKRYNGASLGDYLVWQDGSPNNQFWEFHRTRAGDGVNYVNYVCGQTP